MLTLIRCPFHPRVTAVARKRPRSVCQKYRWQVTPKHAYTLDPTKSEWTDSATVQAKYGNLSGNEVTRNSSGNIWPQSSQLTEPLWTDPGIKGCARANLHFISKKRRKKKSGRGMNDQTLSKNPRKRGKSHHVIYLTSEKAFDSIHHPSLWKILQVYGLPTKSLTSSKTCTQETDAASYMMKDRCEAGLHHLSFAIPHRH